ncbi:3'-5' RNA helicase YTHDC2-like [Diretmus argenteus]
MSRLSASSSEPARGHNRSSGVSISKGLKDIHIDEEVKLAVNLSLERFQYSEEKEMEFPSSLSGSERAFIHRMAQSLGYISKSRGKGSSRFLTIRKKDGLDKSKPDMPLTLSQTSMYDIHNLLQKFPITNMERADVQPYAESGMPLSPEADNIRDKIRASGGLSYGPPRVPQRSSVSELDGFRRSLPVYENQEEIIHLIRNNMVVLVVGETGSGKTTQLGRLCPSPRRTAILSASDMVGNGVDYMHSETSVTPLMVAAGRGFLSQIDQLLKMGASINIKASNGWTALDWAEHFHQAEAVDILESCTPRRLDKSALVHSGSSELSADDQELLKFYHHSVDDEQVDLELIMHLLHHICSTSSDGAVLIFLPGYNEIVSLRDRIFYNDTRFSNHSERYQVFTLHSNMQPRDQKKVMENTPPGVRKIILSTNIAETSITINDVVFVIDSGKVKEKSFDALSHVTMLEMVWISKASALQRKGRAGRCRPGICFHLFSRLRLDNMMEFQVPQLLRMPLQIICLQSKLVAPITCPIAEFLSKAPEPPPIHAVRSAVQMLKTIDAMDPFEGLTDLGYHLADLPVEPHLGKMVLCAVVLKCLDPILTIACTLSYRDPFVLPTQAAQKREALLCRNRFTANTCSDHMALLRSFQAWQKACCDGWERVFCEKNFLSQATMGMIFRMRTQLLGQLRAIGFVRAYGGSDIRDVNQNSENWAVVKAALVAGMFPNLIHIDRNKSSMSSHKETKLLFHLTSLLSQFQLKKASVEAPPTDWFIYDGKTQGNRMSTVRCCSMVTPITVALFGGGAKLPSSPLQEAVLQTETLRDSSDSEIEDLAQMKIDDGLIFQLDREVAGLVFQLRQKWHSLFLRRIHCPSKPWSAQDEATIRTLVSVLAAEEQAAGLQQPTGIGQRPRHMSSEGGPQTSS